MNIAYVISSVVGLAVAITVHESAHAWMADKMGDRTARALGRVSANPLDHIDLFGTVILPAILIFTGMPVFGWAKPVPINPANFRDYKMGLLKVSLAGVTANILTAVLFSAILRSGIINPASLSALLAEKIVMINVVLAFFNLLPIPPLDGYGALSVVLPYQTVLRLKRIEPYSMIILVFFILSGLLNLYFALVVLPIIRMLI